MTNSVTVKVSVARFWRYLRPHMRLATTAFFVGLLGTALLVAAPAPLKFIVDTAIGDNTSPRLLASVLTPLTPMQRVLALSLAAAILAMLAAALAAFEKILNARLRERMTLDLRMDALERILQLTPLCRTKDRSGELVLRLVDDVSQVVRLFSKTLPLIVRHVTTTVFVLGAMTFIHPLLGAIGLGIVISFAWLVRRAASPLSVTARDKRRQEGRVAAFSHDVLRTLAGVQAASAEQPVRTRFETINQTSLRAGVAETEATVRLERVVQIANGIAVAAIIGGGGALALRGHLSVGDLTLIALYLGLLLKPIEKINELASAIVGATSRAVRLAELLDRPITLANTGTHAVTRAEGRITLQQVAFAYDPQHRFEFGSLEIEPGTFVSIGGPSGSGKSTLVALLVRLFDPSTGKLTLDGVAYPDWDIRALRAQFAVSLQASHLLSGSFRDALTFGHSATTDAALWSALERVALTSLVKMRGGLDATIGEAGITLSGGQQARLALARALSSDRPILVLDEPLASIDAQSADVIIRALATEKSRRTIVVVTHQPLPSGLVDVDLWLESGKVTRNSSARARTLA